MDKDRYGTKYLCVECCQSCSQHTWNTRHDEAKYNNFYSMLVESMAALNPGVIVLKNKVPKDYVNYDLYYNLIPNTEQNIDTFDQCPQTGAFEVSYKGRLIFSKLLSKRWPHIK